MLDPWNGAGTSTGSAAGLGLFALGYDLNPAAVVIAKGRLVGRANLASVQPLLNDILRKAIDHLNHGNVVDSDPLLTWFQPQSATVIRCIESAIRELLVGNGISNANDISALAAFFYTALFRTARTLARSALTSNPTWIRQNVPFSSRLRPRLELIASTFRCEAEALARYVKFRIISEVPLFSLQVASSEALPETTESIDFVLTSPPYCTRIDYAIATALELAVLGIPRDEFRNLRKSLMGTCTVNKSVSHEIPDEWGKTCCAFLRKLKAHPSKASATYYFKNHFQYFNSLFNSIREIGRVLKPHGACVIVVQDSFYKDVHNNVPRVVSEIANINGLVSSSTKEFAVSHTLAQVHPGARSYRSHFKAIESVLCLEKSGH